MVPPWTERPPPPLSLPNVPPTLAWRSAVPVTGRVDPAITRTSAKEAFSTWTVASRGDSWSKARWVAERKCGRSSPDTLMMVAPRVRVAWPIARLLGEYSASASSRSQWRFLQPGAVGKSGGPAGETAAPATAAAGLAAGLAAGVAGGGAAGAGAPWARVAGMEVPAPTGVSTDGTPTLEMRFGVPAVPGPFAACRATAATGGGVKNVVSKLVAVRWPFTSGSRIVPVTEPWKSAWPPSLTGIACTP